MPKVAKGRRKRAYRPKTRLGCLTCKIRRVKCDEAQPACLRCTSTHRNMQGHQASATSHIRSGANLLCETAYDQRNRILQHQVLGSKSCVDSYAPLEVLAGIFAALDSQVIMMIRDNKFKLHEHYLSWTTCDDVHFSFSSIVDAKNIFQYGYRLFGSSPTAQLSCDSVHFPAAIQTHIDYFASLLSKFSLALQKFIELKSPVLTPKEDIAIAVLQLHVLNSYISFHEHIPLIYRPRWDTFTPQMKEMVLLGEKIIFFISSSNDFGVHTTSFCLDMGFIIPLYTVASQCRDPILRRRAIDLLRSTPRQEGLWNSLLIAKAAERIMEIEESVLGEVEAYTDCPDQSGLSSIQPILVLDERGGRVQYIQQGQEANPQVNVIEEVFSW
ncbi:hypothetical protein BJ170DRAFT_575586 [Xylariales sp. AK1849]|nr:hypothetical protein BJ170DRAFT_575586 [Xylariales sp. AK1849]